MGLSTESHNLESSAALKPPTLEDRLIGWVQTPWPWALAIGLLLLVQVRWFWSPGEDASSYLSIAKSISQGGLSRFDSAHLHFAPGYSFLLAPAFWLGDQPFLAIYLVNFLLAGLTALGVWVWMRRLVGAPAILLTLLWACNASVQLYTRQTVSEAAFVPGLIWSAIALQNLADSLTNNSPENRNIRQIIIWCLVSILLLSMTGLIRQVGVFLLSGFGLVMLVNCLKKEAGWGRAFITGVVVTVPVFIVVYTLVRYDKQMADMVGRKAYAGYIFDPAKTVLQQAIEGVHMRVTETGRLVVPGMFRAYARDFRWLDINTFVHLVASIAVGWGLIRAARDKADVFLYTLPVYLGFYLIWPFTQDTRYLLPMLPIFLVGLWKVLEPFPRHRLSVLFILCGAHLITAAIYGGQDFARELKMHAMWPNVRQVAGTIPDHDGQIIAYNLDRQVGCMVKLQLNRNFTFVDKPDRLEQSGARWVVVSQGTTLVPGYEVRLGEGKVQLWERTAARQEPTHE